jgi:hypothetical protein
VPATASSLTARGGEGFTLYIMSGADAAQHVTDPGESGTLQDWYAYVNTPEEEADLMKAREEADWIRYASGLPLIRVVDLRLP